jgi:hypothetical protein
VTFEVQAVWIPDHCDWIYPLKEKNDKKLWYGILLILTEMTFGTALGYLVAFMVFSHEIPYERSVIAILFSFLLYYVVDKGLHGRILPTRVKIFMASGTFLICWVLITEKFFGWSEKTRLITFLAGASLVVVYSIVRSTLQKKRKVKVDSP